MNVFDLNANFLRLDEALEESAGEITPEIDTMLNELVTDSKGALESAGFYRQYLANQVAVCKERKAALSATIERIEAKQERLDSALVAVLQRLGKAQRFPEFTLSTQTRTNASFAVAPDTSIADLPEKFVRWQDPVLNLSACKEAHKAGALPTKIQVEETTSTSVMQRKATKKGEEAVEVAA